MNKQASTAMWTAAAVTAALLLGACGGGDGDSKDEIKGADRGEAKSSPSAAPKEGTDTSPPERPQYELAKDAENVFEDAKTGDPKKDAILADNQRRINLIDRIVTTGKDVDDLKLYAKGSAFISASNYIKTYAEDNYSWAGTVRHYDQQVEVLGSKDAKVTFCVDDSKANDKNLKTGKVEHYESSDKGYTLKEVRLVRSEKGIWQANSEEVKRGAKRCEK
ncbi:hypothetical protein [Streptomyces albus]|uniref:hypothetical protein n=1 Tax=Streptomyces albus TaxID=1888 RepID=UPI0034004251